MKKEAKIKLTCKLDLWYYTIALVINQDLKPGSKYVLINYLRLLTGFVRHKNA